MIELIYMKPSVRVKIFFSNEALVRSPPEFESIVNYLLIVQNGAIAASLLTNTLSSASLFIIIFCEFICFPGGQTPGEMSKNCDTFCQFNR